MNTAIFSVIYPASLKYLTEFLGSIENQTDSDFELYLVLDGINPTDFKKRVERYSFITKMKPVNGSISEIRKQGLKWLIDENKQYVIFIDSDDLMDKRRVEVSRKYLEFNEVIFGDLILFGKEIEQPISMFNNTFENNEIISIEDIRYSNCLGLGNTAIKMSILNGIIDKMPNEIIAFDWLFYSYILSRDVVAVFAKNAVTYYRQYGSNIASPHILTNEQILRGITVKRQHYKFMKNIDASFELNYKRFNDLYQKIYANQQFQEEYCALIRNQKIKNFLWWSSIKDEEDLKNED